jgi:hypothetical protein
MCMSLSAKRERVRSLSNASQRQLVSVNVSSKQSVSWAKTSYSRERDRKHRKTSQLEKLFTHVNV